MAGVPVLDDSDDSDGLIVHVFDDSSDSDGSIAIPPATPPAESDEADVDGILDLVRRHIAGELPLDEGASPARRQWMWFMEQIVRMLDAETEDPVGDVLDRFQTMVIAIQTAFTYHMVTDPMEPGFNQAQVFEAQMAGDLAIQLEYRIHQMFGHNLATLPQSRFLELARRIYIVYIQFSNHPLVGADLRTIWGECPPEYRSPVRPPSYQESKRRRPPDDDDGGGAAAGPPVFAGVATRFTQR